MNILRIASSAVKAVTTLSPKTKMIAAACGAGTLSGSLLINCSGKTEREEANKPQTEQTLSKAKEPVQKKSAEAKPKEPVFEYVTPKYDKDGLVVKNDTVWNKEK